MDTARIDSIERRLKALEEKEAKREQTAPPMPYNRFNIKFSVEPIASLTHKVNEIIRYLRDTRG